MKYQPFGTTGFSISRLGFGSMRLPMKTVGDRQVVDDDLAIPMIHRAFELGVNYIDTALFYCNGESEYTVGRALKGWRDRIRLSTKYPVGEHGPYREVLERQLEKLDTDHIDFYHFHGIGEWFLNHENRDGYLADAAKAKEEGLIRHISFSFHDKPEIMKKLVDIGIFSSVLCQYNLLDRANEEAIAYAKEKGLGTVVMGPVGGGRIAGMSKEAAGRYGISVRSSAELALRFVLSNPNVDCALSGMSHIDHVEENAVVASNDTPLSESERADIQSAMEENRRLADLYCTGCDYCLPHCDQEVAISKIFLAMNTFRVWGMTDEAKHMYNRIGRDEHNPGNKADACLECGDCEEHCPQHIHIREQLKECLQTFGF